MQFRNRSAANRTLSSIGLAVSLLVAVGILTGPLALVGAADKPTGQTITLGESLSDAQRVELLGIFQSTEDDQILVITVEDTSKAMEGISLVGTISTAYSSSALRCRNLGDGLDVTTRNISQVTPDLYAIALVTAGIGDAELFVAAPSDAPAGGMTALAGVFKTFELAPCASGSTTPERQRLAIEELAIATSIGQYLEASGVVDGMLRAGNIVLDTQKTMVTERITKTADIETAVRAQETAQGVTIPDDMRVQLVDMMTRLAAQDIDWSTFSAGWTIERAADNTRVSMTGDGIAIRDARRTATAEAQAALTQTAQAEANGTQTAEAAQTGTAQAAANMTATAVAGTAAANAAMTQTAVAALTQTEAARPTETPVPTSTAIPIGLTGEIVAVGEREVTVKPDGATSEEKVIKLALDCVIQLDGNAATLAEIEVGSSVQIVQNGQTGEAISIVAISPEESSALLPILLGGSGVALLGLLGAVVAARRRREPFVVMFRTDL